MSDLIRRSDAIEAVWLLEKEASEYVVDDSKEIHGYCTAIGVCVGELSALPSAEAVQGEWIDRSDGGRVRYPWWENYECNQCGGYGSGAYNYCQNCGAKMCKGGEEE